MSSQNKAEETEVCDTAQEHTAGTSQSALDESINRGPLNRLCEDSELEESVSNIKKHAGEVSAPPLQEDQMRWLVVGICLHSIVSPALREHIPKTTQGLYASLKHSDNIDKQTFAHYLRSYKPTNKELNYESINNNANIPKIRGKKDIQSYNYMVKDEVDFSKLFLTTHMAHFTGFDDTCDSSALLSIIINVDKFAPALRAAATRIRDEVRNPWAHCRFSEWDIPKLQKSFDLMEDIIKCLCLPSQDESLHLQQLNTWKTNALHLLNDTFGYEHLKRLNTETSLLADYCFTIRVRTDENFSIVGEALESFGECFKKLEKKVDELEQLRKGKCDEAALNAVVEGFEIKKREVDSLSATQRKPIRKKYHFYPPPRVEHFVGREIELQGLKDNFFKSDRGTCTQAICGLGGIGKTSLANKYSWECREIYPGGVYWVLAEDTESLLESFMRLSARVDVERDNLQEAMTKTLNWLSLKQERWLLVIDNLDGELLDSDFSELLFGDWKHNICGHILITTRREGLSAVEVLKAESYITLHDLSAKEALLFIKVRTDYNTDDCDDTIKSLVSELHGLPLALEQAAAHIKILKCSFEEYLDSFIQNRSRLKAIEKSSTYNRSAERLAVQTTWNMNLRYVEQCSREQGLDTAAVTVMEIFALLPYITILPDILNSGVFRWKLGVSDDILNMKRIIEILARFSIVNREDTDILTMHRLVKQTVEQNMSNGRKLDLLRDINLSILEKLNRGMKSEEFDCSSKPPSTETVIESEKIELGYLYRQFMMEYELKKKYEFLLRQDHKK